MTESKRKDPKEYMRIAVDVMKQSIPERKKDDPSPFVGAVLVFPDGTYETAYRGEYREGDHAEYTLLDKKIELKKFRIAGCLLPLNHVHQVREMHPKLVAQNVL